jgi:DNA-3-methyladenine glycosylase II
VTASEYQKARRLIGRRDPVMRDLVRTHGACGLAGAQHEDPFIALVHAIISQQLSSKAAATIEGRFDALFGRTPSPLDVAAIPDERLRAAGMSGQKVRYVRDLCDRAGSGALDLQALDGLPDEAVIIPTRRFPCSTGCGTPSICSATITTASATLLRGLCRP